MLMIILMHALMDLQMAQGFFTSGFRLNASLEGG